MALVGCSGAEELAVKAAAESATEVATLQASPSLTPIAIMTLAPRTTSIPAATEELEGEPTAWGLVEVCPDEVTVCDLAGHYWLSSPIWDGDGSSSDGYRYGSNANGIRETHHGVEYEYAFGTDVHSAERGEVIFAGDDARSTIAWTPGFYGNVIILKHTFQSEPTTLFTLYGHLSEIKVAVGEHVSAGQIIGKIGASGTAIGSHLHFETRAAVNDFSHNQNPLLWVEPAKGTGVIAGRLINEDGEFINGELNVQRMTENGFDPRSVTTIQTYQQKYLPVGLDVYYGENFAVGNLAPGKYRLSGVFKNKVVEVIVEVKSKRLAYVNFIVE